MDNESRERDFRIRPRRPKRLPRDEARQWSDAFRQIMHVARMTRASTKTQSRKTQGTSGLSHQYSQRCAVRVTYASNRTVGQWAAHGRYLARESATHAESEQGVVFSAVAEVDNIAALLDSWQQAGDPRLFKLIVSPEFGDRLDLHALTRRLMAKMETDLGTHLQWAATIHHNTEYPHVHVALRGITDQEESLVLPRRYIQHGIRAHAERLATNQLGYRTALDAEEAERREVNQKRYTSLDRLISRYNSIENQRQDSGYFDLDLRNRQPPQKSHMRARLLFLETMGLVYSAGSNRWCVRCDFEAVLRGIQRSADRQRTLAAHAAILSDPRLPTCLTDIRKVQSLVGRVLGHAEDEITGRPYMLLEGTDHKVHFVYHTPDIEDARHRGKLKPNTFCQVNRRFVDGKSVVEIKDLGNSEELLRQKHYIQNAVRVLQKQGMTPTNNGWGGWLGKYDAALVKAAAEIEVNRLDRERISKSGREC